MKITLLNKLINDQKKVDKKLYLSGPYWNYKNSKTIFQLRKKGLKNFRGLESGVGTSFADNLILDFRNELNFKGRIVSSFLNIPYINKIFRGQLAVTSSHIKNYLKNLSIVYTNNEKVKNLIKKYVFEKTTEFGCTNKFTLNNIDYSTHYINLAYRIDILSNTFNFKNIRSLFEIGGGFGSNIHFLLTNFQNIKKIIYLDAVPNIFVGTEYLRYFYGDSVKDYLNTNKTKKISFDDNDKLEIICIPPWQIENLDQSIDHFHNASSFVEMPESVITNYVSHIKRNKVNDISLVSYGGYDSKTTLNPESLNDFFDGNLNIEWHENLIKEYDKKFIFLTSKKN
tara:strand:- start:1522 stop:2541 length:1020 start_codon:yes stop_codon:yes gene_type:complete